MRMHIEVDDSLVEKVDDLTGSRGRSEFVRNAIEDAFDRRMRQSRLIAAAGAIDDRGHDWDADPAIYDAIREDFEK